MTPVEPEALTWVIHRALGGDREFPPPESWRTGATALQASRLSSLAVHLMGRDIELLPHDARRQLEAAALMGESMAELRRLQVAEAAELLSRLGIVWLVLKGWPLAARLYPTPACRPSGDLDLLVSSEDVRAATAALEGIGYRVVGKDRRYHTGFVRKEPGGVASVIELHHQPGPPAYAGPATHQLLASRRALPSAAGALWIPSRQDEPDLLIRHYLRHGADQAILLLDLLKLLNGEKLHHSLGAVVGDDLARLGLKRTVDGPAHWSHAVLRRWMRSRSFEQRRAERHKALVGIPLALSRSPVAATGVLAGLVWPRWPTPRWVETSKTRTGRYTWRLRRLLRFGR